MLTRRTFLKGSLGLIFLNREKPYVMTLKGKMRASKMGKTLVHEHFLVDFIGADKISPDRWNRDVVVKKVLPYLLKVKALGVKTILDCTPNFLGRDIALLKMLTEQSGCWYAPEKPEGGEFKGYTPIFEKVIPALEKKGFTSKDIDQLLVKNPQEAFAVRVRKV